MGSAANGIDAIELFMAAPIPTSSRWTSRCRISIASSASSGSSEIKPDVLILVVSALADKATAVEAMEKGANGFLNKPFTDRQLNDALEELLSRH